MPLEVITRDELIQELTNAMIDPNLDDEYLCDAYNAFFGDREAESIGDGMFQVVGNRDGT